MLHVNLQPDLHLYQWANMQLVIADQHAQSFLSPQNMSALAKAFVEEFDKTNALQQVAMSAVNEQRDNIATRQDVMQVCPH